MKRKIILAAVLSIWGILFVNQGLAQRKYEPALLPEKSDSWVINTITRTGFSSETKLNIALNSEGKYKVCDRCFAMKYRYLKSGELTVSDGNKAFAELSAMVNGFHSFDLDPDEISDKPTPTDIDHRFIFARKSGGGKDFDRNSFKLIEAKMFEVLEYENSLLQKLNGKYSLDNGNRVYYLQLDREDNAFFYYADKVFGSVSGKWKYHNGRIEVTLAKDKKDWTFEVQTTGNDLKILKPLPDMTLKNVPDVRESLKVGTTLRRVSEELTAPQWSPAEIGERVTKFLTTIKSREDISPQNLERQTEVKVVFHHKNPNTYGFKGKVTGEENWTYTFDAFPQMFGNSILPDIFVFSFVDESNELTYSKLPEQFKGFDFETLSKKLQAAGFSAPSPREGSSSMINEWSFTKGKVWIYVSVKGGYLPNIDNRIGRITVSFGT